MPTYTIEFEDNEKNQIDFFETLFALLNLAGKEGTFLSINLEVDGDGAFRPVIKDAKGNLVMSNEASKMLGQTYENDEPIFLGCE